MHPDAGGDAAGPGDAIGLVKCLCSPCTPGHSAQGTSRARDPAGGNRAVRAVEEMHHANVNLKSRIQESRCGRWTGLGAKTKRLPVQVHA
jgi:hypothetical protein